MQKAPKQIMYTGLTAEQSIYRMVAKTNYGPRQNKRRATRQVSWSDFLLDFSPFTGSLV